VWVFGPLGHFGKRLISINLFPLTSPCFALQKFLTPRQTSQAVLSLLSLGSIFLSLPSILGRTVDSSGNDPWDVLAMIDAVLISRQIRSILELTLLPCYLL